MKALFLFGFILFLVNKIFALEEQYFQAKLLHQPLRQISVIASDEGYYPKHIPVFAGEEVQFYFATTTQDPSCINMPSKKFFLTTHKGAVTEKRVVFDRPGIHNFFCPTGNLKGRIVVIEKESERRKRLSREIASEEKKKSTVKIWRPKDE